MTVYLLAHGSVDARHAVDVERIAARLAADLGEEVRPCYLDHCGPTLAEAADVPGTVLPLLISPGYHVQVDVALAVAAAEVPLSLVDPPLLTSGAAWGRTLLREIRESWPGRAVVMVGAGTRDPAVLRSWEETATCLGVPVVQSSGPGPRLEALRLHGRWVVVPLLIARGVFADRIAGDAAQLDLPVAAVAGASESLIAELGRLLSAARARSSAGAPGIGRRAGARSVPADNRSSASGPASQSPPRSPPLVEGTRGSVPRSALASAPASLSGWG